MNIDCRKFYQKGRASHLAKSYAVVTPLRKAASYEPRIAILEIWGDTWLTRDKYGIYMAVRGSYGAITGSMWRLLEILPCKISPIYCCVSYVAVTRIPSSVLRNIWHYVIIRGVYGAEIFFPKFVLRCSYEAALREGVTTPLDTARTLQSIVTVHLCCKVTWNSYFSVCCNVQWQNKQFIAYFSFSILKTLFI